VRALAMWLPLLAATAHAVVLGGGNPDKDCRMAFGGVRATDGESGVVCTDGDPACDVDGVADGTCRFTVKLCTGVPVAGCDPVELDAIEIAGVHIPLPPLPSGPDTCGAASAVVLPVGTADGVTAIASSDGELRDVDYLNLCCRTVPASLDASRCAVSVLPSIAGCHGPVGAVAARRFARARAAVERAIAAPERADVELRHAARTLERVRRMGLRLAAKDPCGDALALVASHAVAMIDARR
jgi:hypothetical protein